MKTFSDRNRVVFPLLAVLFAAALIMGVGGCSGETEEEQVVSKRVRIELPEEEVPDAPPEVTEVRPLGEGSPMTQAAEEAREADRTDDGREPISFSVDPERQKAASKARAEAKAKAKAKAEAARKAPAPSTPEPVTEARAEISRQRPWAINVASFTVADTASRLRGQLSRAGYNAYVTGFVKDGTDWRRVRVGFYASRDEAEKVGRDINRNFNLGSPWVVKPSPEEVASHIR